MTEAPESTEFSSSSLTTLAGRSMTSPAAILFTTLVESCRIGLRCWTVMKDSNVAFEVRK